MSADSVISAFDARTHFSKYLRLIENGGRSVVIRKRGIPRAVLVSIRDYLRLASPEPEILRLLGEEPKRNGTNSLLRNRLTASSAPAAPSGPKGDDLTPPCARHE